MPVSTSKDIEGRNFLPVILGGGLDLVTSKFSVYPGSLQDCLNYESSDTGYTRSQGLLFFDGTYDNAVENMWYIGGQLGPRVDIIMSDPTLDFTVGSRATWETGSGIVVFWNIAFGAEDYVELGLVEVDGAEPAPGNTIVDGETGATIALQYGMASPPTTLPGAVHPATGALLANTISKYLVYLNGQINTSVSGQDYVSGSLVFHGKLPGVGAATGGFQYKDNVYGVRDYYSVGFNNGDTEIYPGEDVVIKFADVRYRGTVARCELTSGEWSMGNATGYIVFKPAIAAPAWSDASVSYAVNDVVTGPFDLQYICKTAHVSSPSNFDDTNWITNDVKIVEIVEDLDQIVNTSDDQLALVSVANTRYEGALWKATTGGWQSVDTGYTVEYNTGTNAPVVATNPMFLVDVVADGYVVTAGHLAPVAATTIGGSPLATWSNPNNILSNNATYATCDVPAYGLSYFLEAAIAPASVPDASVTVLGVEVIIDAKYTGSGAPYDTVVQLVNTATGAQYLSANLAKATDLTTSDANYTYGGQTILWGVDEGIDPQDILDGNLAVRVQYYNPNGTSRTVSVDYISIAVHYVPIKTHVYIWDGAADISEADITAFQITTGMFGDTDPPGGGNNATGYMTLYDVTDPVSIATGNEIRTAAAGGGVLVAKVSSPPKYNLLPSAADMIEHGSKYESVIANFREAKDGQGVYVVTGASPAFMLENVYFSFIRTPQWTKNDKPRHVAYHVNHLALGFDGCVIFSATGVPNDFSAGTGTQYPTGGLVTGLVPLPGDAVLGVWTDRRTMALVGRTPATDMSLQVITDSSGAIEYTVQDIGIPYFADFRGISNVQTSDKFGDFDLGRISSKITPWLQSRLQGRPSIDTTPRKPTASITVRNKNQYRLYFQDGYIMTMTFFEAKAPEFTLQHYDTTLFGNTYVPTFTNSFVLSNGRERNIIGTSDGSVWVVDGANGIQDSTGLQELDAYITLNPTNLDRPEGVSKFYHVVVQGQFFGYQQINAWSDTNYIFTQTGAPQATVMLGSSANSPSFDSINNLDSVYASQLADGYSLKLQTTLDGSKPHTLQSLLFRASGKGKDRNRTDKAY